ncbi:uncharacterized protein LOC119876528 [Canis lupus familiaris]|uniref:uncharacterized protein LOC119876528 n=1 Tax=Canis lupus familiaris TaxID=9615 RepID=UPI0018F54784|nr:uncharacterized protein LOC119876528 [Canis lupus familiaris]
MGTKLGPRLKSLRKVSGPPPRRASGEASCLLCQQISGPCAETRARASFYLLKTRGHLNALLALSSRETFWLSGRPRLPPPLPAEEPGHRAQGHFWAGRALIVPGGRGTLPPGLCPSPKPWGEPPSHPVTGARGTWSQAVGSAPRGCCPTSPLSRNQILNYLCPPPRALFIWGVCLQSGSDVCVSLFLRKLSEIQEPQDLQASRPRGSPPQTAARHSPFWASVFWLQTSLAPNVSQRRSVWTPRTSRWPVGRWPEAPAQMATSTRHLASLLSYCI